jgi:hypothetical protein
MITLSSTIYAATERAPKLVSREAHRVCDYLIAAGLLTGGIALWRRNRPASVISLGCGGSLLALTVATDHIGGNGRALSYATHAKAEEGLTLFLATISDVLGMGKHKTIRRYFNVHAAALTALTNLTEHRSHLVVPYD